MTDREIMQQALEALLWEYGWGDPKKPQLAAIAALRERLAQPDMRPATREEKIVRPGVYEVPVEQEPVRVITADQLSKMFHSIERIDPNQPGYHWRRGWNDALRQAMDYSATPPRREWQGLAADSTIQTVPAQGGLLPIMKEGKDFTISKPWVGLTDEEKLHLEIMGGKSDVMLAEAIEAKLKEKNA